MGRFETTADFYRYREPYPPEFFETVAVRLGITRQTRLLDVGCGPGDLAIGFAQFAGNSLGIDPEPEMLRVARAAAEKGHVDVTFLQGTIEELDSVPGSFDFVTIGRALHWFTPEPTLAVLTRVLSVGGSVAICGTSDTKTPANEWTATFREVRRTWASDPDESRYKIDLDQWFGASNFRKINEIAVVHRQRVSIAELIGRGLSFSITSPAALGEKRSQFEAAIRKAMEPFATNGALEEEVLAKATVFQADA